jgi:hypothetical protein
MNLPTVEEQNTYWTAYATARLAGKTVDSVRYLTPSETESMGWYSRPLVIIFDDGSYVFASKDDEGNDGGALFGGGVVDNTSAPAEAEEWTFPVLRL